MSISHLKPRHRSVVNMIAYALTLENDHDVWCGLTAILKTRLSPFERGCLTATVLDAADEEQFWPIIKSAVPARLAGQPLPLFLDLEAEALWWADLASPAELRAWLTACFVRLPKSEQTSFLTAAKRRVVA